MPLHLDEFQREQLQGYVETIPPAREYKLARFMPDVPVFDNEFAYNVISGGYGQMASVTAWDSGAPLRDKDVIARMTGEVGKVQHSYRLTEKELIMFNRPRSDQEKSQAIEQVYGNTDKLVWGVRDREEWMRSKAVYHGAMDFTENDVTVVIDFMIPAENKLNTATSWDVAEAEPLEDLRLAVDQFKKKNGGQMPSVMHMDSATELALLKSGQVKAQIYGASTDGRMVTRDQMMGLFTALSLPGYEIVSDEMLGDSGTEKLMPTNRVVLIGDDLGETLMGPTAENEYNPGIYVIPEIQTTNPPQQRVFVGESTFPALKRPGAVVHLDII